MTVKEFYNAIGGNYDDVMSRLRTDERVIKFLGKVAADGSFALLEKSLAERNMEEAFRAAHTMKGICLNLSLTALFESAAKITEALRGRTDYGDDLVPMFEELKTEYVRNIEGIKSLEM